MQLSYVVNICMYMYVTQHKLELCTQKAHNMRLHGAQYRMHMACVIPHLFSIQFIIQSMGSRRLLGAFFILFKTASSSPYTYSSSSSSPSSSLPLSVSFLCFFSLPVARLLFVLVPLPLQVFDERGCCCTVHCASAPSVLIVRAGRLLRPCVLRPRLDFTPA